MQFSMAFRAISSGYVELQMDVMTRIASTKRGILKRLVYAAFLLFNVSVWATPSQNITPTPHGPFHVEGSLLVDSTGQPFLIRGTELPALSYKAPPSPLKFGTEFGPHSATVLITIRQRWNMNAVKLPISMVEFQRDPGYLRRVAGVVRLANSLELLVILAASEISDLETQRFWSRCAGFFRDYPNVIFDASASGVRAADAVKVIRASGARQAVVVGPEAIPAGDQDVLIAGFANKSAPILVNLEDPPCDTVFVDPSLVEAKIRSVLDDFDKRSISWIASLFQAGKLIGDYRYMDATTLENGFGCEPPSIIKPGIGLAIQAHLWSVEPHGLFVVNGTTGNFRLPRGGIAIGYGPVMGNRTATASPPLPTSLAGVMVRITDSAGVARLARLIHVAAGWGQINFVVPSDSVPGPARVTLIRNDGSATTTNATVEDIAPGLWTAQNDGRGPAIGSVGDSPIYRCHQWHCKSLPIVLLPKARTRVKLRGTGMRYAGPAPDLQVKIGSRIVPVAWVSATTEPGVDELVLEIPPTFRGMGEKDLTFQLNGRLSNVVRINIGGVPTARSQFESDVPPGFSAPKPSALSPTSAAKVELGRYLFYDQRMSENGKQSCASCHCQELAFTDGRAVAVGATGESHPRSSMSLANVVYSTSLTWSNPNLHSLEQQAKIPMFSRKPVELGFESLKFLQTARLDTTYQRLFAIAFPSQRDPYTTTNLIRSLAAFERTIVSFRSPYDRYHYGGEREAISEAAKRGEALFFDPVIRCANCHGGVNFSGSALPDGAASQTGKYAHQSGQQNHGKFKAPTMRNILLTAPYMHDGSIPTLEGVLDRYFASGQLGDEILRERQKLTPLNRTDLIAFLKSLTDSELIYDPRFSNPW